MPVLKRKGDNTPVNSSSDSSSTLMDDMEDAMNDLSAGAKNVADKAQKSYEKGMNSAKKMAKEVKEDMQSDLSDEMKREGRLGFALYLYAILGYGIFCVESLTCLLLLAAWVVAYERNKNLMKMILSIIVLYLGLKIGYSLFLNSYSLVNILLPDIKIFNLLSDGLAFVKKLVVVVYDFLFVIIGIMGISKARKGKYFKIKFIEELID